MNAPGTMLTIETAPRDATAIAKEGVFIHRRLADALERAGVAIWKNDAEKTAFTTATANDRAAAIVQKLKELDARNGGAPAPVAQAALPPQQVAAPAQAAPVAAQAAPAGRAPRTTNAQANGQVGGVVELLTAIKGLSEDLKAIREAGAAKKDVSDAAASVAAELNNVKAMLAASMKIQEVQLGVLCLFGQQVLNAPMDAFLPTAIEDANAALNFLEQMGKG